MNSLDSKSRDVLRAGQAQEGPSTADRERLRQKLAVALAAGVTGPAIAAPAVVAAKWWASRAVVGSIVSAVVVGVTTAAVVVTRKPDPAPVVAPAAPTPVAPSPAVPEPVVMPEPQPEPVVEQGEEPEPAPKKPQVKRPRRVAGKSEPVEETPAPIVVTAPAAPEKPTPDELEAETQGLREVQLALRAKDHQRALGLLDQQDRRFAQGQLRQEREGARVLALCATDAAAGSAAFERFRTAHPTSPMLARLKGACVR